MSVPDAVVEIVRARAGFACEYCGVSENEARGQLTIDHYRPVSNGGDDDLANLVYACFRCNQYKADYWPTEPRETRIWNPREEPSSVHLFELYDGRLLALSDIGRETIRRLRLNRNPLVQARMAVRQSQIRTILINRLGSITSQLARTQLDRAALVAEENALLEEQRRILEALRELEP